MKEKNSTKPAEKLVIRCRVDCTIDGHGDYIAGQEFVEGSDGYKLLMASATGENFEKPKQSEVEK